MLKCVTMPPNDGTGLKAGQRAAVEIDDGNAVAIGSGTDAVCIQRAAVQVVGNRRRWRPRRWTCPNWTEVVKTLAAGLVEGDVSLARQRGADD